MDALSRVKDVAKETIRSTTKTRRTLKLDEIRLVLMQEGKPINFDTYKELAAQVEEEHLLILCKEVGLSPYKKKDKETMKTRAFILKQVLGYITKAYRKKSGRKQPKPPEEEEVKRRKTEDNDEAEPDRQERLKD
eukprot:gb/GECG01004630.1/.p1 GENE.gb/GECG01004630.1/~~gb/GECG01004630.1/.p1  ORF type:complete len:135 (+),score=20.28 gb/GECG01004630.1/:1-405(+)